MHRQPAAFKLIQRYVGGGAARVVLFPNPASAQPHLGLIRNRQERLEGTSGDLWPTSAVQSTLSRGPTNEFAFGYVQLLLPKPSPRSTRGQQFVDNLHSVVSKALPCRPTTWMHRFPLVSSPKTKDAPHKCASGPHITRSLQKRGVAENRRRFK